MKKNDDFLSENENLLLNRKRERSLESMNKFVVKHNNLTIKKQIKCKQKQKKIIFDKSKANEIVKIIENFFVNKYGMKLIKEYCFICHSNNYLSNKLLYFENEINLFYYLNYIFSKNNNDFNISKDIFSYNKNQINKYNELKFLSIVKFSSPIIICKQCFQKILNEKNIIETIIKLLQRNLDDLNSNTISYIEIKKNDFEVDSLDINSPKNEASIPSLRWNNKKAINSNNDFNLTNVFNSSSSSNNVRSDILNRCNNNHFINNNYKNIDNRQNNFNLNNYNINNNIFTLNIRAINDIFYKNNIIVNLNEKEKLNANEFSKIINNERIKYLKSFNNSNFDNYKPGFMQDSKNIEKFINNNYINPNITNTISLNLIYNEINKVNEEIKDKNINVNANNINFNINEIDEHKIKHLFSNNFIDLILCLNNLEEKISEITHLSQQLKYQYDYLLKYFPKLIYIRLSYNKNFFLLHFIASTEILNNLILSYNYIFQRINILLEIVNCLETKPNLNHDEINELKILKVNIQNLFIQAEKNDLNFRETMNNFLAFLKDFMYINGEKKE